VIDGKGVSDLDDLGRGRKKGQKRKKDYHGPKRSRDGFPSFCLIGRNRGVRRRKGRKMKKKKRVE